MYAVDACQLFSRSLRFVAKGNIYAATESTQLKSLTKWIGSAIPGTRWYNFQPPTPTKSATAHSITDRWTEKQTYTQTDRQTDNCVTVRLAKNGNWLLKLQLLLQDMRSSNMWNGNNESLSSRKYNFRTPATELMSFPSNFSSSGSFPDTVDRWIQRLQKTSRAKTVQESFNVELFLKLWSKHRLPDTTSKVDYLKSFV